MGGRRLATRVHHSCKYCRKTRGVRTAQQKGDLAVEQILPGYKPNTDDALVSLTEDMLLQGRHTGALVQPQVIPNEQYLGASIHQQDLVDLWWKPWKKKVSCSIQACVHLKEIERHADHEAEPSGEEDQESKTDVQRSVLLGSTNKVELLRIPDSYVLGPLGACCPGPPSDAATQNDSTADVASSHDPSD